ncbi:related to L-rhamnono-gamma-lactonase [Cephalotrichum gorgonifer]|uniref:Related to L-rhamnono-gamma-lactonase n=1 Tax=Cephalotrichum gorgonifer TaxID=2041049 RepID=A0AAE8SRJ2_9PEZI|nr:related to L-rhamnono-gamma-lactonase [Cephalotrichum gorgonifer]
MTDVPIIDCHIHLYPEAEIPTLAWAKPGDPLAVEHGIPEYDAVTAPIPSLKGFVLVETDRKSDLTEDGWKLPLMEVAWFARVATGKPNPGEVFSEGTAERCLGIIPWAPVPAGPAALEKYIEKAREVAGEEAWRKVKGFRYLLQDKPHGTMLTEEFIEGVQYLGRKGYIFSLGVDSHRRGKKQLEETVEMIGRAHDDVPDEEKVTFIINHMCKADLAIYNLTDPGYVSWRTTVYTLSSCEKTYMQISGGLQDMPESLKNQSANDIFAAILPYLGILLATFGPDRLIFGSDWPVCTLGIESNACVKWLEIVKRMCHMASLEEDKVRRLFAGTAIEAFGLDV